MEYLDLLRQPVYGVTKRDKEKSLVSYLRELTKHHQKYCEPYRRFLEVTGCQVEEIHQLEDIPFLPVRLFKEMKLSSIASEEVFKIMTSSGTTGQQVSKIVLDKQTAANQQKTLTTIVSSLLGHERIPMLIIDTPNVIKNRASFSARGAGILGFSIFGSKKKYALDEDMNIDVEGVQEFLEQHKGKKIFVFGFTFMIWQYFYKPLKEQGMQLDISNGVLVHGGGWKKLKDEAVESLEFHRCMKEVAGIEHVHDYYGMVEQTGCIYVECECGHLHASTYSDILIRKSADFTLCDFGETGVIQVLSPLAQSYPGHSLLTEDQGVLLGEDDCPCGRCGKYFNVLGRIAHAEIRGCSDTFER